MKARPVETVENNMNKLEKTIKSQLKKAWSSGVGHGARAFAQVISDIIHDSKNDEDDIITKINDFVEKTLKNNPQQIAEAFMAAQKKINELTEKE